MPSRPRGAIERLLFRRVGICRFRCRACLHRFARRKSASVYIPLFGARNTLLWVISIATIVALLAALTIMGVRTRHASANARVGSWLPPPLPLSALPNSGGSGLMTDAPAPGDPAAPVEPAADAQPPRH